MQSIKSALKRWKLARSNTVLQSPETYEPAHGSQSRKSVSCNVAEVCAVLHIKSQDSANSSRSEPSGDNASDETEVPLQKPASGFSKFFNKLSLPYDKASSIDSERSSSGASLGVSKPSPGPTPQYSNMAHKQASQVPSHASHANAALQQVPQQVPYESITLAVSKSCPPALKRNTWSISDFDLRRNMYNGQISMVYHAVDKRSGITIALKLYKRSKLSEIERHQVAREIRLHAGLAHSSIIALYAAWKDPSYVYLALEWAPGGDVYSYLHSNGGRLTEEAAVTMILEPFLSGLAAIHAKGLIHRDIKPENILLNNSFQIKIADFGLSIDCKSEVANTRLGTIDYLAPEILDCPVKAHPSDNKQNPGIGYSNKVDCWSVGILAYELLVGKSPFTSPTARDTLNMIRNKDVEYPSKLPPAAVDFMRSVLVRDPLQRPSIEELLQHPWISHFTRRRAVVASRTAQLRIGTRRNSVPKAPSATNNQALAPYTGITTFSKEAARASPSMPGSPVPGHPAQSHKPSTASLAERHGFKSLSVNYPITSETMMSAESMILCDGRGLQCTGSKLGPNTAHSASGISTPGSPMSAGCRNSGQAGMLGHCNSQAPAGLVYLPPIHNGPWSVASQ